MMLVDCRNDERGATIVEASIALPFLIVFLIGAFQMAIVLYHAVTIEFVVTRVSREIAAVGTRQTVVGLKASRLEAIKAEAVARASGLGVTLVEGNVYVCPAEINNQASVPPCSPAQEATGRPNELLVVTIIRDIPIAGGVGQYAVRSSALVRNEPFREPL